jgi:hypothetical protein
MNGLIFPKFYDMHPELKREDKGSSDFENNDKVLKFMAERIINLKEKLGLKGLVGDLQNVIINVEKDKFDTAVNEFLNSTNYYFHQGYKTAKGKKVILKCEGSADIVLECKMLKDKLDMFLELNNNPKSRHLPHTRLEVFVFECYDIKKYVDIQRSRGVIFASNEIVETDNYLFIQTIPSSFTGNSIGVLQWKSKKGEYQELTDEALEMVYCKPDKIYLKNVGKLDHAATRVKAEDRDSALIEFMELTDYKFEFSIYLNSLNSITNVARLKGAKFAAVFTSGIRSYTDDLTSGPTEKFVHNYGLRVHHLAFETEDIDYAYNQLNYNGFKFLSEVVGTEAKGIKQAFSEPSVNTLLVHEYVCRYGGFTGFFIEENVELLTKATDKQ